LLGLPLLGLRFPGHFLLTPQDAAPLFVVGNRHPTLNADANPLFGRGFLEEEKLSQEGHGHSPVQDERVTRSA
jgi:hypothetical protein